MVGTPIPHRRRPPPLYRHARTLRRVSTVVLVVILLLVAFEVFSATQVIRTKPGTGNFSAQFEPNDTLGISGSFTLGNAGYLPISGFSLHFRLLTANLVFLGATGAGPVDLAAGGNSTFPVSLFVPLRATPVALSLLTEDQYLTVHVWANATYGYLFPVSLSIADNKSWGAPFSNYQLTVGAPNPNGSVPVTLSFQNQATFAEEGAVYFVINSTAGPTCGSGSFPISVPPQGQYQSSQPVAIAPGCDLAGASVTVVYLSNGVAIPLPSQVLP